MNRNKMPLFSGAEGVSVGETCLLDKTALNVACNWTKFVLEIVFTPIPLVIVETFTKK